MKRLTTKGDSALRETYDTPIPEELRPAYESWYRQLPKNLQYTGDYDLQGAWLERLGRPTKYEATQNGHLDDYGKKPNHPTFSSGSKWHDPKVPERTGGEWKKSADGSWDFYPGSGNVLTDEQLKDYFDKYEKGSRVHPRNVRQAAKAGDAGRSKSSGVPSGHNLALDGYSGPRVVVNPSTFRNEKDAMCVAWNESFRILMEVNGFDPVSEPTEKQRKFFSDTAYNDDELMLRRTILARICTFDTSVKDPTDEQLQEAMEFLDTVMEIGAPQNEWEQRAVKRIRDMIAQSVGQPRTEEPSNEEPPEDTEAVTGAIGGGESEDDLEDLFDQPLDLGDGSLDDLFDTRSNTEKETAQVVDEIGKEGSAVVEGVEQLDPEGTKKALEYGKQMSEAVSNGFDASTQLPNSDPPQITSTSSSNTQGPDASQPSLLMKNGHYVDGQGRVITKRAAEALAARRGNTSSQPVSTISSSTMTGIGGRKLTAGEAAWQERRKASGGQRRLNQIGPNVFSSHHGRDLTVFI